MGYDKMMKFGLTEQLAQSIVERTAMAIPHNVNVMNGEGVIIASRDKQRVGQLHQGALKAINLNELFEVHQITITDRPGVNVPIKYQGDIVGVIGISGEPDTVRSLGHVLKLVAELIIEQQYAINKDLRESFELENFLQEWCSTARERYTEDFRRRAEARGISLEAQWMAVMAEVSHVNSPQLEAFVPYIRKGEYICQYNGNILMLFHNLHDLEARLERIITHIGSITLVGVGEKTSDVANSVKKAQKAILIAKKIGMPRRLIHFYECVVFDMAFSYPERDILKQVVASLEQKFANDELIQTLTSFFKHNGDVKHITEELHVHRNTLSYRLRKIEECTGKSIRNYEDLFYLYLSCVVFGLKL